MAVPILAFLATMGARYGAAKAIKMAIKKFGKKALQKATNKMSFVGKNVAKKPVKKKAIPAKTNVWKPTKRFPKKGKIPKPKGTNPYTLADWKQGIKYPAKMFKKKP